MGLCASGLSENLLRGQAGITWPSKRECEAKEQCSSARDGRRNKLSVVGAFQSPATDESSRWAQTGSLRVEPVVAFAPSELTGRPRHLGTSKRAQIRELLVGLRGR